MNIKEPVSIWYWSAYDQPGGASSRTFDYAKEFAEQGCNVWAFTNSFCHYKKKHSRNIKGIYFTEVVDSTNIVWLRSSSYYSNGIKRWLNMFVNALTAFYAGLRIHKKSKPDVIIAPSVPLLLACSGWLLSRLIGAKFVFEVRDIWPQTLVDLGAISKRSFLYKILRKIEIFLYKKADLISVVLPGTIKHIADSGVTDKKVFWHPNAKKVAINLEFKKREKNDGVFKVTYVGGFALTHDVENIVNAAEILSKTDNPKIVFEVYGDGLRRPRLEELCRNLGLKNINFYGAIEKSRVIHILEDSDILLACVKDTPAYQFGINSNKIVDYLVTGRPIIFCGAAPDDPIKLSGSGESIAPSEPEKLVESIRKICSYSDEELEKISQLSHSYVKESLDISKIAHRYLSEIYEIGACSGREKA